MYLYTYCVFLLILAFKFIFSCINENIYVADRTYVEYLSSKQICTIYIV